MTQTQIATDLNLQTLYTPAQQAADALLTTGEINARDRMLLYPERRLFFRWCAEIALRGREYLRVNATGEGYEYAHVWGEVRCGLRELALERDEALQLLAGGFE